MSDEWGCLQIQKIDRTLINETHEERRKLSDESVLRIKRSDESYSMICADNWNNMAADLICTRMGYAKSIYWSPINLKEDVDLSYVTMTSEQYVDSSFFEDLKSTESCAAGIVALKCLDYGKYF